MNKNLSIMDVRIGEIHTCMQYDLGEIRDCEILFIYKEDQNDRALDIILYRYFGKNLSVWFYKAHRRFEVYTQIQKAVEEKQRKK